MPRLVRSFRERASEGERRDTLNALTLTDRLLAHILIELMETRARRSRTALATRLEAVGLTRKQVAALLETSPSALAVARSRAVRDTEQSVENASVAVDQHPTDPQDSK